MARRPNVAMRKRQRELRKAEKAEKKRAKRFAKADGKEDDASALEYLGEETGNQESAELFVEREPTPEITATRGDSQAALSAYCKVCRVVHLHTPVEVKVGSAKRVKCTVCGDAHPFLRAKPAPRKRATKSNKAAPDGGSYKGLLAGRDSSQARPYDMCAAFGHRALIDHPAFGIGVVARVLPDRKIEVLFPEGARTLAHDR